MRNLRSYGLNQSQNAIDWLELHKEFLTRLGPSKRQIPASGSQLDFLVPPCH